MGRIAEPALVRGSIIVEMRRAGEMWGRYHKGPNLITQVGDQFLAERAFGISGAPAVPVGMKLGSGSTAPSKTGTGAALGAYLADSNQAFEPGYPASSTIALPDSRVARRIEQKCVWAAGKATTVSAITEVALVNDALADATTSASNTIARALISGVPAKDAEQELSITWRIDLIGSSSLASA